MSLHKNCGWWKNSDCVFEFSLKSYVTNTINLSCAKILLPSVIIDVRCKHEDLLRTFIAPTGLKSTLCLLLLLHFILDPLGYTTVLLSGSLTHPCVRKKTETCEVARCFPRFSSLHAIWGIDSTSKWATTVSVNTYSDTRYSEQDTGWTVLG